MICIAEEGRDTDKGEQSPSQSQVESEWTKAVRG